MGLKVVAAFAQVRSAGIEVTTQIVQNGLETGVMKQKNNYMYRYNPQIITRVFLLIYFY
jgi:hypothetical protein